MLDQYELVNYLLSNGIKDDSHDIMNRISLHYATKKGDPILIQHLLDHHEITKHIENKFINCNYKQTKKEGRVSKGGNNSNSKKEENNRLVLMSQGYSGGSNSDVNMPISQEIKIALDIDNPFEKNYIEQEDYERITKLFVNTKDNYGNTPLHAAVAYNNIDIIKCLIRNYASFYIRNEQLQVHTSYIYIYIRDP